MKEGMNRVSNREQQESPKAVCGVYDGRIARTGVLALLLGSGALYTYPNSPTY